MRNGRPHDGYWRIANNPKPNFQLKNNMLYLWQGLTVSNENFSRDFFKSTGFSYHNCDEMWWIFKWILCKESTEVAQIPRATKHVGCSWTYLAWSGAWGWVGLLYILGLGRGYQVCRWSHKCTLWLQYTPSTSKSLILMLLKRTLDLNVRTIREIIVKCIDIGHVSRINRIVCFQW